MSVIDRDRWRVLAPLLDEALELSQPERISWLDNLRASDPSLAAELTSLLVSDSAADDDDFLRVPPPRPLEGLELGAWTLERPIGQGGMGSVWLARRTDGRFEGTAAVKFLNLSRLGSEGERRFRREGSLLARLSHTGIARLLDAGVAAFGQPYLVLEYIEGQPIDTFADQRCLTIHERIGLVQQVLAAVHHAHGNLIVHRDLKPSNIFVRADGTVKLLDFGIAKLLDQEGADDQGLTIEGRALTPQFAAPEQLRGGTITTTTDVYAVGVLLYALSTGVYPYDLKGRTPAEVERIVGDVQPPRPSTWFAANARDGEDVKNRAAARSTTPDRLRRRLQGDLDAILMKALAKEPSQRFTSAHALADDLRRHLSGHAVLARPQSTAYRARRFVRRHRVGVLTALGVGLLIAGYAATVTVQRAQIRSALADATLSTRRAEQVTDFMMSLFNAAEGGRALTDSITAPALLSRGIAQARLLSGQPALEAQMLDVIGRLYMQLGEYDRSLPLLKEALEIRRRLYGDEHPDVATSLQSVADAATVTRNAGEALALRRQVLDLRRRLAGSDDPKAIDALYDLARDLHRLGQDSAAWPLFEEWSAKIARQPREVTPRRAEQLEAAAEIAGWRGDAQRAESGYRQALTMRREIFGPRHPLVARTLGLLGDVLQRNGRTAEAEPILRETVAMLRESYPEGHPALANNLRPWAAVLQRMGRVQEALAPLREALDVRRRLLGEGSVDVAISKLDVANVLTATENYREAEELARSAVGTLRGEFGDNNAMVIYAQVHVGDALRGQGRFAEAEPLLLAGYERFKVPKPVTTSWRNLALAALARFHEAQGHAEEAKRLRAMIQLPQSARPRGP